MFTWIKSFEIYGLYGIYDHRVFFQEDESVCILHGPNGTGKTALLRAISYLFGSRFSELGKIPFGKIEAVLSNGMRVEVLRRGASKEDLIKHSREHKKLEITVFHGKEAHSADFYGMDSRSGPAHIDWDEDYRNAFLDLESTLTSEAFKSLTIARLPQASKQSKNQKKLAYVKELLASISVSFIQTDRLYVAQEYLQKKSRGDRKQLATVRDCANTLASMIGSALTDYGVRSQELDQSFIPRFVLKPVSALGVEQLKAELRSLSDKVQRLRSIGILDNEGVQSLNPVDLDVAGDDKISVLSLFVRDSAAKLEVFDSISERVQILLTSLNRKFNNKRVELSREKGLVVYGAEDVPLELEDLSSGEQHEIVLMCELLFKVKPGSLVLIDEPELSLHMSWQKSFLDDLLSISSAIGFYSIVATHSPFIVGSRHDLMVSLGGGCDDDVE